jgi:hypothetical protein
VAEDRKDGNLFGGASRITITFDDAHLIASKNFKSWWQIGYLLFGSNHYSVHLEIATELGTSLSQDQGNRLLGIGVLISKC